MKSYNNTPKVGEIYHVQLGHDNPDLVRSYLMPKDFNMNRALEILQEDNGYVFKDWTSWVIGAIEQNRILIAPAFMAPYDELREYDRIYAPKLKNPVVSEWDCYYGMAGKTDGTEMETTVLVPHCFVWRKCGVVLSRRLTLAKLMPTDLGEMLAVVSMEKATCPSD